MDKQIEVKVIDCDTCKHHGMQPFYPSACTGCCHDEDYANYEECDSDE